MSKNLFSKLSAGASFDLNKFEKEAITFKLKKPKKEDEVADPDELKKLNIDQLREQNEITFIGEDVPDPLATFEEMYSTYNLPSFIMKNLKKAQFTLPTAVQTQAIPLLMDKRELICCSFTGSGKTLSFLLPVIAYLYKNPNTELLEMGNPICSVRSVILAPTVELAKQIYRESLWFAHGSSLKVKLINNVYKFQDNVLDVLITTPKRLVFLLKKKQLTLNQCEFLVVDECDRLFDHSFRPQLSAIYKACSDSPKISRALFSATFNKKLEKWFQMNLDNVVTLLVGKKLNVPRCIKQELKYVGDSNGKYMAVKNIIEEGIQPPVLIFCQYRRNACELFARMKKDNHENVSIIHSGIKEDQRLEIINKFREGKIWFLICTDLMGRGMDFKGVSCLINYDYPHDPVSYIHRIGRTGRAGKYGRAITLFTNDEVDHPNKLRYIVRIMKQSGWPVPEYLSDPKQLAKLPTAKREKKFYTESGKLDKKKLKEQRKRKMEKAKKRRKISKENDEEIESD